MGRKIATCSYCGTRAALVFDEGMHELTCRACGAPLHEMKMMPHAYEKKPQKPKGKPAKKYRDRREASPEAPRREWRDWPAKYSRKKRRKPMFGRVLEELWDVVEDIID